MQIYISFFLDLLITCLFVKRTLAWLKIPLLLHFFSIKFDNHCSRWLVFPDFYFQFLNTLHWSHCINSKNVILIALFSFMTLLETSITKMSLFKFKWKLNCRLLLKSWRFFVHFLMIRMKYLKILIIIRGKFWKL